jgi:hypothetical protein
MQRSFSSSTRFLSAIGLASMMWVSIGCGGAGLTQTHSSRNASLNSLPASRNDLPASPVEVRIGDNPSSSDKQIVSFQLSFTSIKAVNKASGDWVQLFGTGSAELIHSAASSELVASGDAPQESFDQLVLQYSGASLAYLNSAGALVQSNPAPPGSETVDLSGSPIVIGAAPIVLSIKVDVPSTVNLNLAQGTATLNVPSVTVSQTAVNPTSSAVESGHMQAIVGQVTNVSGNNMTVTLGQENTALVFQTNPTSGQPTTFENISLGTALNMLVSVSGSTQADGSLYASDVSGSDSSDGLRMQGIVSGYNLSGTMFIVAQDGIGGGITPELVSKTLSLDVSGTSFAADSTGIDLSGVNLTFDQSHFFPGQQVEVESSSSLITPDPDGNAAQVYPWMVNLEQQTVSGVVANYTAGNGNTATFDLVLPSDGTSYLNVLNPAVSYVHVYQQSSTSLYGLSTVQNGQSVQVRGLLFSNDNSDNAQQASSFMMVAARIAH